MGLEAHLQRVESIFKGIGTQFSASDIENAFSYLRQFCSYSTWDNDSSALRNHYAMKFQELSMPLQAFIYEFILEIRRHLEENSERFKVGFQYYGVDIHDVYHAKRVEDHFLREVIIHVIKGGKTDTPRDHSLLRKERTQLVVHRPEKTA